MTDDNKRPDWSHAESGVPVGRVAAARVKRPDALVAEAMRQGLDYADEIGKPVQAQSNLGECGPVDMAIYRVVGRSVVWEKSIEFSRTYRACKVVVDVDQRLTRQEFQAQEKLAHGKGFSYLAILRTRDPKNRWRWLWFVLWPEGVDDLESAVRLAVEALKK